MKSYWLIEIQKVTLCIISIFVHYFPLHKSESYGGKDMKKFSVLLMILAIVCALFADKIDMAVKGNKKVKKVIVVFSVGVLLVCTIAIVASILA